MLQQFRYDRAQIGPNWEETPEGFLRVPATFARSGVQRYRRMDGTEVVEYRPEEEVSREDALLSLANLPVTLEHPTELLTPDTARQHMRGFTGSHVEYRSPFATGVVTITDREAIEAVKRGDAREVSVGYRVMFDPTPGITPQGERYDGIQRAISGNHLAITREARGGHEMRLHFDSAIAIDPTPTPFSSMTATVQALTSATAALTEAIRQQNRADSKPGGEDDGGMEGGEDDGDEGMDGNEDTPTTTEEDDMATNRGDSISPAEYQRVCAELERERTERQRDLGRMDSLVERLDSLEAELQSRADAADQFDLNALVNARLELLEKAEVVAGQKIRLDGAESDREIMVAALVAAGASADRFDGLSDDFVAGQFEASVDRPSASADILSEALRGVTRSDSVDPVEAARTRMTQEAEQAYATADS